MDTGSYQFKSLENKYDGFRAPAFEVSVDGKTLESSKFHFSSITVDIDAGEVIDILLFSYQGVRMLSPVLPVGSETPERIIGHIQRLLLKEE